MIVLQHAVRLLCSGRRCACIVAIGIAGIEARKLTLPAKLDRARRTVTVLGNDTFCGVCLFLHSQLVLLQQGVPAISCPARRGNALQHLQCGVRFFGSVSPLVKPFDPGGYSGRADDLPQFVLAV